MCGIAGVFEHKKAAEVAYFLLHLQQHRATDSAGIATSDGVNLLRHTGEGIVQDVFDNAILDRLFGQKAIGHIRYSTTEDDERKDNTQPVMEGNVALVHNGNITNTEKLRAEFGPNPLFRTSMDTELFLKRWHRSKAQDLLGKTIDMLTGVLGTYSLLLMTEDTMIAIRDPWGNRPLWVGERNGGLLFASESVAFDNIGQITDARELLPGEIMIAYPDGSTQSFFFNGKELVDQVPVHNKAKCFFEVTYYSHPGSTIFGIPVAKFRKRIGEILARNSPSPASQVVAVPDSAIFFAAGYGSTKGYTYAHNAIARSHFIGRSFIKGLQALRVNVVARKFMVIIDVLEKAITLIDDSIVRGTTMGLLVKLLRDCGIKNIHLRVACPPITHPCHYGIDTPTKSELLANSQSVEQMRQKFGLDSLEFLTLAGLHEALVELGGDPKDFCFACLTGDYPIETPDFDTAA